MPHFAGITRNVFLMRSQRDDERFDVLKSEIPWSSVALAVGLMLFGIASFVVAWLHVTQEILGKEQAVSQSCVLGALAPVCILD